MKLDWPGLMRLGLGPGGLRLRPAQFWALTPAEMMLMLGLEPGSAPMARARLAELAAAWPDQTEGQEHGND